MAGQNGELSCQKMFGWPKERENCKPKYSWIAKTSSDGTPVFFLYHAFPFTCTLNTYSKSTYLVGPRMIAAVSFDHTDLKDSFHIFAVLYSMLTDLLCMCN